MPIYLSSLFMWPIVHFADEPYLGRKQRLNRRRSHQGSLLMLEALHYIRYFCSLNVCLKDVCIEPIVRQ